MLNFRFGSTGMATISTLRPDGSLDYRKKFNVAKNAPNLELGLDEIISDPNTAAPASWININGKVVNSTNHMGGKLPEGANVLALDGHVEARRFITAKALSKVMNNGNGAYWFPNP
jgi:prepilin-type processing-associated H-X9-DG protein